MNRMQRVNPVTAVILGGAGLIIGLGLQSLQSALGRASIVPPTSLVVTLVMIAVVLLALGVMLRVSVRRASQPVNPFFAVRLLAGSRAGQFVGAFFAGFGAGLLLQLLTRSVMPPASTWSPMLLTLVAGLVLHICGVIAEALCRVPPGSSDPDDGAADPDAGPEPHSDAVTSSVSATRKTDNSRRGF